VLHESRRQRNRPLTSCLRRFNLAIGHHRPFDTQRARLRIEVTASQCQAFRRARPTQQARPAKFRREAEQAGVFNTLRRIETGVWAGSKRRAWKARAAARRRARAAAKSARHERFIEVMAA